MPRRKFNPAHARRIPKSPPKAKLEDELLSLLDETHGHDDLEDLLVASNFAGFMGEFDRIQMALNAKAPSVSDDERQRLESRKNAWQLIRNKYIEDARAHLPAGSAKDHSQLEQVVARLSTLEERFAERLSLARQVPRLAMASDNSPPSLDRQDLMDNHSEFVQCWMVGSRCDITQADALLTKSMVYGSRVAQRLEVAERADLFGWYAIFFGLCMYAKENPHDVEGIVAFYVRMLERYIQGAGQLQQHIAKDNVVPGNCIILLLFGLKESFHVFADFQRTLDAIGVPISIVRDALPRISTNLDPQMRQRAIEGITQNISYVTRQQ